MRAPEKPLHARSKMLLAGLNSSSYFPTFSCRAAAGILHCNQQVACFDLSCFWHLKCLNTSLSMSSSENRATTAPQTNSPQSPNQAQCPRVLSALKNSRSHPDRFISFSSCATKDFSGLQIHQDTTSCP